jgi:hypothetical protein
MSKARVRGTGLRVTGGQLTEIRWRVAEAIGLG